MLLVGVPDGYLKRVARAGALLLPLACSEGTGPAQDAPLPDEIPSGTIEMRRLDVPAGKQHTIEGDVVIVAEEDIRIDGTLVVAPGASLSLAAGDSLVINGSIGEDPAAAMANARAPEAMARLVTTGNVYIAAQSVVLAAGAEIRGLVAISVRKEGRLIRIDGSAVAHDGAASTTRGVPGEDGDDIEIGTDAANVLWSARGITDTRAPVQVVVTGQLKAGNGGAGFDDAAGTIDGRTVVLAGSNGGNGGRIAIRADQIDVTNLLLTPGSGGRAGGCGGRFAADPQPIRGADGTASQQAGFSIRCITGDAGSPGVALLNGSPATNLGAHSQGLHGFVWARAGNGGPGGAGGSITADVGTGRSQPGLIVIESGGSGGDAGDATMSGGIGGSITILDKHRLVTASAGGTQPLATVIVLKSPLSNGGNGRSGCVIGSAFAAGTKGGDAGQLFFAGTSYEIQGTASSFTGGSGGAGTTPGAGGKGGIDDAGKVLGSAGIAGLDCPGIGFDIAPVALAVNQAGSVTATASIARKGDLEGAIAVTIGPTPAHVTATANPAVLSGDQKVSVITFTAGELAAVTPEVTIPISATATGVPMEQKTFTLVVKNKPTVHVTSGAASLSLLPGQSKDIEFTSTRTNYDQDLDWSFDNPNVAGLTGEFDLVKTGPTVNTVKLTVRTAPATPILTIPGTVRVSGPGIATATATFDITIGDEPGIALTVNPLEFSVNQGSNVTATAAIVRKGNLEDEVTIVFGNTPAHITATANPAVLAGGVTTSLITFAAGEDAAVTTAANVTITASTSGGVKDEEIFIFDVKPKPAIAVSGPTLVSIPQGQSRPLQFTPTFTNYGGNITWSFVDPEVAGLSGTFDLAETGPSVPTVTLTLQTATTTATGTYSGRVNISGAGVASAAALFDITVQPPASLSVTTPSTATATALFRGQSTALTINTQGTNYSGDVDLSVTGVPSDVATAFTPSRILGGTGSSTLTFTPSPTAELTTFTYVVQAVGTGVDPATFTRQATVNPAPSYTLSLSPSSMSVNRNTTSTASMFISKTGTVPPLTFRFENLPDGLVGAVSPATVTGSFATASFSANNSVAVGVYQIPIVGMTSGITDRTVTATVTVTDNPPNFNILSTESPIGVIRGQSNSTRINITKQNGFDLAVSFEPAGPQPLDLTFDPLVTTGSSTTAIVSAAPDAPLTTFTINTAAYADGWPRTDNRTTSFSVRVFDPPTTCGESPITLGSTVTSTVSTTDCVVLNGFFTQGRNYDPYTFTLASTTTVRIDLSSTAFDTFLFLRNADGTAITSNDNIGGGNNNSRIISVLLPGTYQIWASSSALGGVNGEYTLSLTVNP